MSSENKPAGPTLEEHKEAISNCEILVEQGVLTLLRNIYTKVGSTYAFDALLGAHQALAIVLGRVESMVISALPSDYKTEEGLSPIEAVVESRQKFLEIGLKEGTAATESSKKLLSGPVGDLIKKLNSGEIKTKEELDKELNKVKSDNPELKIDVAKVIDAAASPEINSIFPAGTFPGGGLFGGGEKRGQS